MARHDSTPTPEQKQPDAATIRGWLGRARAAGNYFVVFRPFYRILSKLDALFLCDLLNVQGMSRTTTPDGYFLCTNRRMESFGWTVNEQKMRWPALVEAGLVRIERRGSPPLRWVFIDLVEIERRLDVAPPLPDVDPGDFDPPDDHSSGFPTNAPHSSARLTNDRQPKSQLIVSQTDGIKETPSVFLQVEEKEGEGNHATAFGGSLSPPFSDLDSPQPRRIRPQAAPAADRSTEPPKPGPAPRAAPAQSQGAINTPAPPARRPAPVPQETEPGALFAAADAKTTRQDHARASTLCGHVVDMGWRPAGARKDWGPALGVLRRECEKLGDPADLIDRVLDKYITDRINKPTIKSGAELRAQWDWVLRVTGFDAPPAPEKAPLVIDPMAAKYAGRALKSATYPWSDDDVRELAQRTLTNFTEFTAAFEAFRRAQPPTPDGHPPGRGMRIVKFVGRVMDSTDMCLDKHLRWVAENLAWRTGHTGGVDKWVWTPWRSQFAAAAKKVCDQELRHLGGWPALYTEITGKPYPERKGK